MKIATGIELVLLIGALPCASAARDFQNRGPQGSGQKPPELPIQRALDANGDGVIDAKEIARATAKLKTLDKNGDGTLSGDELMPSRPGRQATSRSGKGQDGPGPEGEPGQGGPGGMASGTPGQRGPGGFGPPSDVASCALSGSFTANAQTLQTTAQAYTSDRDDVSAVYACNGGTLALVSPKITTSGNTSSQENSSFYGLNAAVLAGAKSRVTINGGWIRTSGEGANGAFATGKGAAVVLNKVTINATGGGGHGVMATGGGNVTLNEVTIHTLREHGAALATDRGGGTIIATGGTCTTAGEGSPGIYSTGLIVASNTVFNATGAEGAVIEGENVIDLTGCAVTGHRLCGAMLYQSFSGDAEGRNGHFTMRGGSFTATEGPLFRVTNAKGFIALSGVKTLAASGVLISAEAGRWGRSGANGGHAVLTAEGETLAGNLICDDISTIDASLLKGTTLTGVVQGASLTLDATSTWSVTGDSEIKGLSVPNGSVTPVVARIIGNGHTIRYDAKLAANGWLKGGTYALSNGGHLIPTSL